MVKFHEILNTFMVKNQESLKIITVKVQGRLITLSVKFHENLSTLYGTFSWKFEYLCQDKFYKSLNTFTINFMKI